MNQISLETLHQIVKGIKEDTSEIKIQVSKTNGRVRSLEIWRGYMAGGMAVIIILVVPIIIYLITKLF